MDAERRSLQDSVICGQFSGHGRDDLLRRPSRKFIAAGKLSVAFFSFEKSRRELADASNWLY